MSPVEQIKAKLSIVDVLGSYLTLEKAGANFKARCPFHNEKTPSFFISPARNSYYCFGCGAKGDIFSFVQQFEGLDFVGALRVLAKRAGVELERENPKVRTEREKLYLMMEHATIFFQTQLSTKDDAKQYILKRGLTAESAKSWRLGYAPLEWKALSMYFKAKGFSPADLEKVGLVKKSDKGSGDYYDRFRGRIMFPLFDSSGRVIAFSGRQFESDGTEAKYLNSPETVLFEKSKVLYGYDRAKLEMRRMGYALLVEGQMDLLMSHQVGLTNAVASSGTALTLDQLELIKRLAPRVVIAYDADDAGAHAATRGWQLALQVGLDVRIATLPKGKDPADLAVENPEALKETITKARHLINVELDRIVLQYPDARERGLAIQNELLSHVAVLESAIEQGHFIGSIAHAAGIKEEVLWEEVRKRAKNSLLQQDSAPGTRPQRPGSRRDALMRPLWGLYFWLENKDKEALKQLDIYQKMCNIVGNEEVTKSHEIVSQSKDELIFEAEVSFQNSTTIATTVAELFRSLEEEWLRERFGQAMKELADAEKRKDADKVLALLNECQNLSEKIRAITHQTPHL
jgi:DNA primase